MATALTLNRKGDDAGGLETSTDSDLLKRFLAGDEAAFTALVQRHASLVLNVCHRILRQSQDAEDAFQATFLVLARKSRSLEWQDSIAGWLHQTARRTALKLRGMSLTLRLNESSAARAIRATNPAEEKGRERRPVMDRNLEPRPAPRSPGRDDASAPGAMEAPSLQAMKDWPGSHPPSSACESRQFAGFKCRSAKSRKTFQSPVVIECLPGRM